MIFGGISVNRGTHSGVRTSCATAMGVTIARVSQIETGELTSVEVLSRYAEALGGRLRLIVGFGDDIATVSG